MCMRLHDGHFSSTAHQRSSKIMTSIRKFEFERNLNLINHAILGFREILDRFLLQINFKNPNMHTRCNPFDVKDEERCEI